MPSSTARHQSNPDAQGQNTAVQGSGEKGLGLAIPAAAIGPGADLNLDQPRCSPPVKAVIDFFSTPAIALLIAVIAGILILGRGGQMNKDAIAGTLEKSLPFPG